ncbi:DNA-binding MarR family transcriptional regulator [Clostridium acetobutylicum]|uniref:MarR family HTH transcriptional regulator n=1 Tax=Clostridium acetobutylicum (strain ATCC 824 / DSM 792 / JCM 1419 / IAM 19013 / LMG 5710 / NBRC 13948 / NRRL B-527 / VKM B-1787 / 2291 / W) TaxID=272562 RepID=Q97TP6_CLOAB|nr:MULTISPECIES: MarR family transcriptional regulator [Clostridium]AAK76798.1 MarR family HTH transcriptional regulator [Clostridium acetobutylicum ATCC 824]ADZ22834.1 MarR family HTH transcriptional regulator [Clostridium acetobutylicum EA 2018]AEI34794.1 MarR family HTH transcriptional regulator [Clostridium acetobutylicum DSM 1731]AWV82344.1 MarR family transcriptional regulator [Clostridium acetobutylicum]MBC2395992.1 MarR family transcriptional regulator [Clostridium acetobutylicum]
MNKISEEQYKRFDAVMHSIYKRLRQLHGDIDSMFPKGITSSELSVLKAASKYPNSALKEIGEYLDIPGSTLTSIVDRLEKRNLVRRTINKENRRSYALELTKDGIELSNQHEEAEKELWEKVLMSLNEDVERETLINLLDKISKGIE